jgi:hypothetical protein
MITMKIDFKGFAAAALLVAAFNFPAHAEDAPAATTAPAQTQAAPAQTAPSDVARPAVVPKADAATDAGADAMPRHHRRYARYHYRHYAMFEPFPIFLPHLYHNRIVWNRMSWFRF